MKKLEPYRNCKLGYDKDYAPEVVGTEGDERVNAFVSFGKRLEQLHETINGHR